MLLRSQVQQQHLISSCIKPCSLLNAVLTNLSRFVIPWALTYEFTPYILIANLPFCIRKHDTALAEWTASGWLDWSAQTKSWFQLPSALAESQVFSSLLNLLLWQRGEYINTLRLLRFDFQAYFEKSNFYLQLQFHSFYNVIWHEKFKFSAVIFRFSMDSLF